MTADLQGQGGEPAPLSAWSTLVRSFGELAAGEIAARALGFVAIVMLTRRLGPSAFGLVTLGSTLVLWFALVVDSGTELTNLRDIARSPESFRPLAGAVLGMRLAIAGVAGVLFAAGVLLIVRGGFEREVLVVFALALPALALNLRWMVLGLKAARAVAAGNVAAQLLFTVGVVVLVQGHVDAPLVGALQAGGELLYGAVVLLWVGRRFGFPVPRIDLPAWRENLRQGWPLMANQLARAVVQSFDLILIGAVLGTAEAGLYGAAYKPILFFTVLAGLLSNAFLASYSAAEPEQAARLLSRTLRLTVAATVPIALALSIGAGEGLRVAFGAAYAPAGTALAILAWAIVLAGVGGAYGRVLVAAHEQAALMRHNVIGAALNVGTNLVVIPLAGIEGAAVVTLVSEALVVALNHRTCAAIGRAPTVGAMFGRARGAPAR